MFIGQNLKHVHMTYYFLELLILFCLEFISHHTKEILNLNTNFMENQPWNTNHELVSNIDVEKTCFFQPVIRTRIYVLHKITIALKFMSYINSDFPIPAKKLQTPG